MRWTITVPGEPRGKGRPRFSRQSGRTYTPRDTEIYENLIRLAFESEHPGHFPAESDLSIEILAVFQIPRSWSKKKQQAAIGRPCRKKPDFDNIAKAVCDALNGVAYRDDAQIADAHVRKIYGEIPRVEIVLEELIE